MLVNVVVVYLFMILSIKIIPSNSILLKEFFFSVMCLLTRACMDLKQWKS